MPLLGLEGFIYLQSGDSAQARVKLAQALDMSERVFGDQDARRAVLNELLGKIAAEEGRSTLPGTAILDTVPPQTEKSVAS